MTYTDFFSKIESGTLSGAYLFHGDEEFVKNSALSSAKKIVPEETSDFNITILTEPGEDDIINTSETLPLFADKKLVICHGISSTADPDNLIEYFSRIPEFTVLIIDIKGVMQEKSKLLKYFKSTDREVLFSELSEGDVIKWCMKTAVKNQAALDRSTARTFVGLVGTDMTKVSNELQKACDMVGPGGVITPEIISKCTVSNVEVRIFEMLDCFTSGKVRDGMALLSILLEDENEALGIASFLESRFKLMLEGKRLMEGGRLSPASAASKMEGSRFANEKACKAALKYSISDLSKLVMEMADVGYRMISGGNKASVMIKTIMLSFKW